MNNHLTHIPHTVIKQTADHVEVTASDDFFIALNRQPQGFWAIDHYARTSPTRPAHCVLRWRVHQALNP